MQLYDITSIGRSIDPKYPTIRAIGGLSLVVVAAGMGVQLSMGMAWLDSAWWGLSAGLSVFFAWALGRELDPDHDLSAFVGAGLMIAGLTIFGLPELLFLAWLLIALRLVNRTTGLPAKVLDSIGLLGLGGWLAWQEHWVAGIVTAVAFFLDARLELPVKRHGAFAALALAATVVFSIFTGAFRMVSGPTLPVILAAVVIGGLFAIVVVTSREITSVGDATGLRLNARRVRAAQWVALGVALATAGWEGLAGIVALLPLWAAMLGIALYRVIDGLYQPEQGKG